MGIRIKRLREKHKLTQAELGKKLNLSKQTISSYENGSRSPDPQTVTEMSKIFGVSTDFLLGQTENPEPKRELPQTVAPYLPEGFEELPPEAKEEIFAIIDYVMTKYRKKEGDENQ